MSPKVFRSLGLSSAAALCLGLWRPGLALRRRGLLSSPSGPSRQQARPCVRSCVPFHVRGGPSLRRSAASEPPRPLLPVRVPGSH